MISREAPRIVAHVWRAAPWLVVLSWLFALPAMAQPVVVVRAESRLELDVRRGDGDDGLDVSGALRDDLGAPLPDRDVSLELSRAGTQGPEHVRGAHLTTRTVRSGDDGSFSLRIATPPTPLGAPEDFAVDATYEGDDEHVGTRATRFFDVDRAHVALRLTIEGGARIDLTVPEHSVEIVASSAASGAGLEMTLTDDRDATLGGGVTDASGALRIVLASDALGPPAAGRLIVRTLGDSTRTEAQTEVPVVRFRPTSTTLEVSSARLTAEEPLHVSGRLTDGQDALPREAIGVLADEMLLATLLTDDDGRFETDIALESFGDTEGRVSLVARFAGDAPWLPGSDSEAVAIEIVQPTSWTWLWALASIVASTAIAIWSLRRERTTLPRRARGQPAGPGVVLGARSSIAATRMDVAGIVRDTTTGEPLAGIDVTLAGETTTTDARGHFAHHSSTRGTLAISFEGPDHRRLEASLTLPHRGELAALAIRLAGRRATAFAALRRVASHLAGSMDPPSALTQRELLELLRSRGASPPALPQLVSLVENACYGPVAPDDAELAEADAIAEAIVRTTVEAPASPARPAVAAQPRTER